MHDTRRVKQWENVENVLFQNLFLQQIKDQGTGSDSETMKNDNACVHTHPHAHTTLLSVFQSYSFWFQLKILSVTLEEKLPGFN